MMSNRYSWKSPRTTSCRPEQSTCRNTTGWSKNCAKLITVNQISPEVRKAWAESLADWPQSVADELNAQGLPATQVLNLVLDRAEANGYEWPVRYEIK